MKQTLASHPHLMAAFESALAVYHRGTAEHCARVGSLASAIASQLGLPDQVIETVQWAGVVHDIGKIAVPESILSKPGPLTPEERREIERHPSVGAELLSTISVRLAPIAEAVRGHHECWDGSGYPDGLIGETIPVSARIVAVADVFDAMTHRRIYRAQPFETADVIGHLIANAGRLYDADVVDAFLHCQPAAQSVRG